MRFHHGGADVFKEAYTESISESITITITTTWGHWGSRLKVGYACSGRVGQQKHGRDSGGEEDGECRKGHWGAPIESGGLPGPLPRRVTLLAVRLKQREGGMRQTIWTSHREDGESGTGARECADTYTPYHYIVSHSQCHTVNGTHKETKQNESTNGHGSSLCLVYFT